MIEVCPVCFKFLETVLDKKKMREVKPSAPGQACRSMYHKKLTDR